MQQSKQSEIAKIPKLINKSSERVNSKSLLQPIKNEWMGRIEEQHTSEQIHKLASKYPAAQEALDTKINELEDKGISDTIYHIAGCRAPQRPTIFAVRKSAAPMRTFNI